MHYINVLEKGTKSPYGDRLLSLILDSFIDSGFNEETDNILEYFSDWLLCRG